MKKIGNLLLHLAMLAIVCAIGAYWVLRILTPAPSAPPPPIAAPALREADPVLAARMFGLVQAAPIVASNVQQMGVFAAGKDSSAILAVDGKPARVVLLGQSVSPGSTLAEVRPDGVTLDNNGARQELKLPLRAPIAMGGPPAAPAGFTRDGNTLSAPGASGAAAPSPNLAPGMPMPGAMTPGFPAPPATPIRPMQQPMPPPPESPVHSQPGGAPGLPTQ